MAHGSDSMTTDTPPLDLQNKIKEQKVINQLLENNGQPQVDDNEPMTGAFWRQVLLHEDMPKDDYVKPPLRFTPGTLDVGMPNRYETYPSYLGPDIPGTLDAPSIQFPDPNDPLVHI
jgi:hypothetical protein